MRVDMLVDVDLRDLVNRGTQDKARQDQGRSKPRGSWQGKGRVRWWPALKGDRAGWDGAG